MDQDYMEEETTQKIKKDYIERDSTEERLY